MGSRIATLAGLSLAVCLMAQPVQAQGTLSRWKPAPGEGDEPVRKKIRCEDLKELTNHEFTVTTAETVSAAGNAPEYCYVSGLILPEVRFQVALPSSWNRRFLMPGSGGFAGFLLPVNSPQWLTPLRHGFAVAFTDTGHDQALEPLASFGGNRAKVIDYAYRAVHVTTLTAKELVAAYYELPLKRSYFMGCSTGGRQALMSAQRFPQDFDGIVSGAPVLNQTRTHVARVSVFRALREAPIPLAKVKLLADAIYTKCDSLDGLADGLIDDPRRCDFQPARDLPRCAGDADAPSCFTAPQIRTLEIMYRPVTSNGQPFFPGLPVGAEVFVPTPRGPRSGWDGWILSESGPSIGDNFTQSFLRFMAFGKPDPAYDWTRFDPDKDPARIQWLSAFLDATNPDLSRFRDRGGKLLMYFGWADPALNPLMGVDYYEKVVERMGPKTADFFRLFMAPGMFHCGGGPGPDTADSLTAVMDWVEKDVAPASLLATKTVDAKVTRTRPLCPYPEVAKYKGTGSIDEAPNFSCVSPK